MTDDEHVCATPLTAEPVGTEWDCPACGQLWRLHAPGTRVGDWRPVTALASALARVRWFRRPR